MSIKNRKMTKGTNIPVRTRKKAIQEARGVCAFCSEKDVSTLEFHHINGRDVPDPHNPENLIYVCKNCHGKITAGVITISDVVLQKRILKYAGDHNAQEGQRANVVNISGCVNTGTIANVVHFHPSKKKQPRSIHPGGSIGADLQKRNYLKHLIDRYHEFAKAEKGSSFKYPVFYQAIKRKYGAKWDMIPIERFEDVCRYVQKRIDLTVLGKTRRAKGQCNFSAFAEYSKKYGRN